MMRRRKIRGAFFLSLILSFCFLFSRSDVAFAIEDPGGPVCAVGLTEYASLHEALEDLESVPADEDKEIELLRDADESDRFLVLSDGVCLNLAGHTLSAKGAAIYDASIRNTAPAVSGGLAVPFGRLLDNADHSDYLPVYDPDGQCYRFYYIVGWYQRWSVELSRKVGSATFNFRPYTETNTVDDWRAILREESGVRVEIEFELEKHDGTFLSGRYDFRPELYPAFLQSNRSSFTVTFYGTENCRWIKARARLLSAARNTSAPYVTTRE